MTFHDRLTVHNLKEVIDQFKLFLRKRIHQSTMTALKRCAAIPPFRIVKNAATLDSLRVLRSSPRLRLQFMKWFAKKEVQSDLEKILAEKIKVIVQDKKNKELVEAWAYFQTYKVVLSKKIEGPKRVEIIEEKVEKKAEEPQKGQPQSRNRRNAFSGLKACFKKTF